MRSLVITAYPPVRDLKQKTFGSYNRLSTFVQSIVEICEETEILHFVDAEFLKTVDENSLGSAQVDNWGTSVKSSIGPPDQWRQWEIRIAPFIAPFSLKHDSRFPCLVGKTQISIIKTKLLSQPDFIFAHRLSSMRAISQVGKSQELPPVFFDLDDVEHRYAYRRALHTRSLSRALYRLSGVPKVIIAERKAIRAADKTFVCSEVDRSHLASLRMANIVVIPNAVVVPKIQRPVCPQRTVLFLGNYRYPPNAEAAERLISRIWPLVLQQDETAHLIVAGDCPELIRSYRLRPINVEFTGLVSNLNALYERSRIICCPIITGGGTRLKLIEAAAYTKPIITTPVGAEGLLFENDKEILIRNSDAQIAAACCRLLSHDIECLELGSNAYRKSMSLYDVDIVKQRIKSEMLATLKGDAQNDAPSISKYLFHQ
jgi:glycosyltransferase involved in cell wall biosynthesis